MKLWKRFQNLFYHLPPMCKLYIYIYFKLYTCIFTCSHFPSQTGFEHYGCLVVWCGTYCIYFIRLYKTYFWWGSKKRYKFQNRPDIIKNTVECDQICKNMRDPVDTHVILGWGIYFVILFDLIYHKTAHMKNIKASLKFTSKGSHLKHNMKIVQ